MIARLTGVLDQIGPDGAVIDVGGVGYLVFCSTRTLGRLPQSGGAARVLVETHVREDHIHLYGFFDAAERDWFRILLNVQGVGEYSAVLNCEDLNPRSLKLPVPESAGPGPAPALPLDARMTLMNTFLCVLDGLFAEFVATRVDPDWEARGLNDMRNWIKKRQAKDDSGTLH